MNDETVMELLRRCEDNIDAMNHRADKIVIPLLFLVTALPFILWLLR